MSYYDKMKMKDLVRQINRLEWAADTTDDYEWQKYHLSERLYCIRLLLDRFNSLPI
jgi:hypothetical protein